MHPVSTMLDNLLSTVACFFDNNVLPFLPTIKKRKHIFTNVNIKRTKLEMAEYHNDLQVELPPEIWELIVQKFDIADYHCFSAVCRSWRSIAIAAKKQNHHFSLQQLPWLMLSYNNNSVQEEDSYHHGFFSLSHGKIFRLKLPEVHGARCFGSSSGWLIMASESGGDNFLLNPFSRLRIQLPSQTTLPVYFQFSDLRRFWQGPSYIRRAMLLSAPAIPPHATSTTIDIEVENSNCIVVAIYSHHIMCFCRPGDQAWTSFESMLGVYYEDIIFYDDQLYAITNNFDLVLVELGPNSRGTPLNMPCPEGYDRIFRKCSVYVYLVESFGELLMVVREWKYPPREDVFSLPLPPGITTTFTVFKFDKTGPRWIKIDNIGDQILFLGTSSGISLLASRFSGFKGNCIYFTDDNFTNFAVITGDRPQVCRDLGVFSFEDGSIKSFFPTDSHSSVSPPVWFMPSAF